LVYRGCRGVRGRLGGAGGLMRRVWSGAVVGSSRGGGCVGGGGIG